MRISLNPEAEWYDLLPGHIRVFADPAIDDVFEQAADDPEISRINLAIEATDDPDELSRLKRDLGKELNRAVACLVISEWEGVEDEDGKPAPVSPEYITAVLRMPALAAAWDSEYMAKWLGLSDILDAEKNGFAPSLTGTSAVARNTATPARPSAKSAPKKKTARKR